MSLCYADSLTESLERMNWVACGDSPNCSFDWFVPS